MRRENYTLTTLLALGVTVALLIGALMLLVVLVMES